MHPFKEEKRLNLPKFAPAVGYLGITSTVIAYSKRKKSSKIWKGGGHKNRRGGHNMKTGAEGAGGGVII